MFGLDAIFGLAGGLSGGSQKDSASADTITVDTGPQTAGGGAMTLNPAAAAAGVSAWAWVLIGLAAALLLRRFK